MIHIIIPVHNRLDETKLCLKSLSHQTYSDWRAYVVDDGSADETREYLRKNWSNVTVLEGDGNLWWTGAMRLGVEEALKASKDDDYIMSLNNDVCLSEKALEQLVEAAEMNFQSVCNAISIDRVSGKIMSSGAKMYSWALNVSSHPLRGASFSQISTRDIEPIKVDMLTGRSVLYPVKVFHEVGNFDDRAFPHYGGDIEFTCRAAGAGWNLLIVPRAVAYVNNETTGLNPISRRLSVSELFQSLVSMRSSNNLRFRTRLALRIPPWYARPTYMLFMYIKIFVQLFIGNALYRRG